MQISVNGQSREITPGSTLESLVSDLDLGEKRFAIEVNEELVPRTTFAGHLLEEGDQVEIVHAIGGG